MAARTVSQHPPSRVTTQRAVGRAGWRRRDRSSTARHQDARTRWLAASRHAEHRGVMRVAMRCTWCVAAGLVGLLGSAAFSADLTQPDVAGPMVHYQDGRLSARIHDVPLDDVLRAVTAETGVRFEGIPLD